MLPFMSVLLLFIAATPLLMVAMLLEMTTRLLLWWEHTQHGGKAAAYAGSAAIYGGKAAGGCAEAVLRMNVGWRAAWKGEIESCWFDCEKNPFTGKPFFNEVSRALTCPQCPLASLLRARHLSASC